MKKPGIKAARYIRRRQSYVRGLKIAARCMALRGIEGCFENGEIASQSVLAASFNNMPILIKIILPSAQADQVLPKLEEMIGDGS